MPWAEHEQVAPPPASPSPPPYHPEFGYLSPSPHSRRSMRVGLIAGACGILLGAVGVSALTSGPGPNGSKSEPPSTVGRSTADHPARVDTAAAGALALSALPPSSDRSPPPAIQAPPVLTGKPTTTALAGPPDTDDLKPADPPTAVPQREKTVRVHKRKHRKEREDSGPRTAYGAPYAVPYRLSLRQPVARLAGAAEAR